MNKRIDGGTIVSGLILIAIGTFFLLDELHIADFGDSISRYWPLAIVAFGIPKLFDRRTVWSGLWTIAIGFWMLVSHLGWWGLTWGTSWPLLLIALGAGMTLRALLDPRPPRAGQIS